MRHGFSDFVNMLTHRFFAEQTAQPQADFLCQEMLHDVETARKEWLAAKAYFQSVTDPDLVDHAIFLVEAAEKKYMYLLKKAREANINAQIPSGSPLG